MTRKGLRMLNGESCLAAATACCYCRQMKRCAYKLSTVCISLYLTKLINRFHVLISVKLIFMYQIRTQPVRLNKTDLVLFEHLSGLKVLLKYMHLPVKKFLPYPSANFGGQRKTINLVQNRP